MTRMEKYRKYRASILAMDDGKATPRAPEPLLPPSSKEPSHSGISRSTTTLQVAEIIRDTQEIDGQPIIDYDKVEQAQKRRFILKVILVCLAAVAAIIIIINLII